MYVVKSKDVNVKLSDQGEITGVTFGFRNLDRDVSGFTRLEDCVVKDVGATNLPDGGMAFTKTLFHEKGKRTLTLIEHFIPNAASIRWEIEIKGDGPSWSAPIQTRLRYPATEEVTFWTAWADPRGKEIGTLANHGSIADAIVPNENVGGHWADPLVSVPMRDVLFYYGAPYYEYTDPKTAYCPFQGDVICIPLATVTENAADMGLSLILSPEDLMLDMTLETTKGGEMVFTRMNHRLGSGRSVRFAMDLVAHEADWRAALGWMTRRYGSFFDPPNALAHEISGTGAYSRSWADFDVEKLKKMAFIVNWKASHDFPYMGMFLPPVADDVQWNGFWRGKDEPRISIRRMREYSCRMREYGFHVLSYFNVTEFGSDIVYPAPPRKAQNDADLWKDPNDFLYGELADAILRVPEKQKVFNGPHYGLTEPGKPFWTWGCGIVLDPGELVYQDFLLEQARRHIKDIPESSGICIDRMDWLRMYNHDRDDGVSWYGDQSVRSLLFSWRDLMNKLGPILHDANKVIYVNNHIKRIEQLRHVDGVFDEFTYAGCPLNTVALMCVRKPALGWMSQSSQLKPDPDAAMQKYLYLGVFPMAPFPANDHSLMPDPWVDRIYLDYGPLMILMRGKKWVLEPHVIEVVGSNARANVFEVPEGCVMPVVYAGDARYVQLVLHGKTFLTERWRIRAFHPGMRRPMAIRSSRKDDRLVLDVPVKRGCAMVQMLRLSRGGKIKASD
ncbi:MAG: hypothetical protein V1800_08300 [Candidatus Latescibacterota bacterium]